VGAHLPIASGLALGDLYQKTGNITICMFGDGATNIGFFHEALNLSKVWNLPIVWVCENNQYGMGTAVERASAVKDIRKKADGYAIPNSSVDGMDIMKVREAALDIFGKVRSGNGPYFLEALTYRYRGHSMGDPERYRKTEEIHKWQENDPIGIYRKYLVENGVATEDEMNQADDRAVKEVEEAVQFAESSPEPTHESLYQDIYVEA
jgi:pyruvate dehydrogenase E1 component alpha subunit